MDMIKKDESPKGEAEDKPEQTPPHPKWISVTGLRKGEVEPQRIPFGVEFGLHTHVESGNIWNSVTLVRDDGLTVKMEAMPQQSLDHPLVDAVRLAKAWKNSARTIKDSSKPHIIKAPGANLLALVNFLFSPKAVEQTFKPLVSDWRYEYFDALKQGRTKKARWITFRYRFHFARTFIMAMGLSKVFSLFKQLSK